MSERDFGSQAEADRYVLQQELEKYTREPCSSESHKSLIERTEQRILALTSPVYKLSDDILVEIFKTGALVDDTTAAAFAIKASHVVSRWRRVALGCPALWSTLAIDVSRTNASERQSLLSELLLRRSFPVPIHLKLILPNRKDPSWQAPEPLHLPPSVYKTVFERCGTLTIPDPSPSLAYQSPWLRLEDVAPFTSLLTKLEIVDVVFPSLSCIIAALRNMPSLRQLSLDRCKLSYDHRSAVADTPAAVALTQLTSLVYLDGTKASDNLTLSDLLKLVHTRTSEMFAVN